MHTIFHGVVKSLFDYWFSIGGKQSLKLRLDENDRRLLSIRPPNFVNSPPRSIKEYKNWRAHEFMNFILYYSLIVFKDIMKPIYYDHLKLLVISLECLSLRIIKNDDLLIIEKLLFKYVSDLSVLYTESIMTSGFHELIQLT